MESDERTIRHPSKSGLLCITKKCCQKTVLNTNLHRFKHFHIVNCVLFLCCCLSLFSCSSPFKTGPVCYDIKSLRNSKELFDYKGQLTYIPLETSPDCVIGAINKIILTSDHIFVFSRDVLNQFDTKGKFIRKIGSMGRGPAEYSIITDVAVDEALGQALICDLKKINIYDLSGGYLGSKNTDVLCKRLEVINNMYVVNPWNYTGKEPCMLKIIEENNSPTCFKNDVLYNSQDFFQVFDFKNLQKFDKELIFHQQFNDTIYRFDPRDKTLSARYYFDFGNAMFPLDLLENIGKYRDESSNYGYLEDVCENGSYIFVTIFYKGENERYVINKKNGKSYAVNENQFLIWPRWSDERGTLITFLHVGNLLKHKDEIADSNLKNILPELKEENNPVIVLMK